MSRTRRLANERNWGRWAPADPPRRHRLTSRALDSRRLSGGLGPSLRQHPIKCLRRNADLLRHLDPSAAGRQAAVDRRDQPDVLGLEADLRAGRQRPVGISRTCSASTTSPRITTCWMPPSSVIWKVCSVRERSGSARNCPSMEPTRRRGESEARGLGRSDPLRVSGNCASINPGPSLAVSPFGPLRRG
jgi:hypothetical protein